MIVNLKRCLSIFLVMMLLIGIIPAAYAVESGADSTQPEKTVSEGTESTDSIDPTEPTEPTEPPDIANPQDDYAVMSVGSTQKSIMLFDYADNGNYTTVLKSQVSCEYKPNGTGAARTAYIKNLGWHFARYGGVAYPDEPLYCIEPWRNYGASTSGNSVDRGVTLDGSGSTTGSNVWYAMSEDYREAIGLILLYSDRMWDHSVSVTTTKKDSNPNVPLRIATQFLIYEIVCGLRDPATFKSNSVNVCGTSGDIFYNAGEASVPYFAPKYNALVDAIQAAKKIPSFTTASDGTILTDYLLPGTYTIKEIIPEDSPYTCDAPNPQIVAISAGQTAEVKFTNRMKPGEIRIQKTDTQGEPLPGAEFLLEWSKDGRQWQTVTYTDSPDVTEGTCTAEGLTDGKLTSGADGEVRFTGLYSGSLYRVTEVKAPKGYQLLTEPVYEGSIRKDDGNFIRLTVVNAPVFELPMTGSTGYTAMTAIQVGTGVALLLILIRLAKKRK